MTHFLPLFLVLNKPTELVASFSIKTNRLLELQTVSQRKEKQKKKKEIYFFYPLSMTATISISPLLTKVGESDPRLLLYSFPCPHPLFAFSIYISFLTLGLSLALPQKQRGYTILGMELGHNYSSFAGYLSPSIPQNFTKTSTFINLHLTTCTLS